MIDSSAPTADSLVEYLPQSKAEALPPIKIGGVAQHFGVSVDLLRLYEREGLLIPLKSPKGRRDFTQRDYLWIAAVLRFFSSRRRHTRCLSDCSDVCSSDLVLRSLEEDIPLDRRRNHTIEVVVDRLLVKPGIEKRLEASIETAIKLADGLVLIAVVNGEERLYSRKLACTECGTSVPQLEPRSFSFNSPYGACEECTGLGSKWAFDPGK